MSRCNGETYLSWGFWGDPDGPFTVQAECNGGSGGDCGWRQVIERGDHSGGIESAEWRALEAAHASYCEHEETP